MKVRSNAPILRVTAAGLVLLTAGCKTVEECSLTYRLWDTSDLARWSEPAPAPNLALFETTNGADVLVQYDAFSEKHSVVKRRAYYLYENAVRVEAGKEPKWASQVVTNGLNPIPVLPAQPAISNPPPEFTTYSVVTNEGREFVLRRPMEPETTFDLPVYSETYGTPMRLVLTPFALAGDTVMVGGVAAVVGFLVWLHMGAPTR